MLVRAIWHVSFTVRDLEASVAFYRDLLGLELVHEQVQDNAYTRKLVGLPDARLRVAQLRVPGLGSGSGHHVELVQYDAPSGDAVDTRTQNPGTAHLAFMVDDIHTLYRGLRDVGVRFRSVPIAITEWINKGGFSVYFLDPDGITLELVQPPAES